MTCTDVRCEICLCGRVPDVWQGACMELCDVAKTSVDDTRVQQIIQVKPPVEQSIEAQTSIEQSIEAETQVEQTGVHVLSRLKTRKNN